MKINFVSQNSHKISEATSILAMYGIEVEPLPIHIEELQTLDTTKLVRNKALQAFSEVRRPLFVEHTGLYLDLLGGFPGGLTQIFWDKVGKDDFAKYFSGNGKALAKTLICYIDGMRTHVFEGDICGSIVSPPRFDNGFQWDCVFIPEGYSESFSEMGEKKNEISMRLIALRKFAEYLTNE